MKVLELILKLPDWTKHFLRISLLWGLWPSQSRSAAGLWLTSSHTTLLLSLVPLTTTWFQTLDLLPLAAGFDAGSHWCSPCFLRTWFPAAALPLTPAGCQFHWVPWLSSPTPALYNPQWLSQLQGWENPNSCDKGNLLLLHLKYRSINPSDAPESTPCGTEVSVPPSPLQICF